jgi:MFS family permease
VTPPLGALSDASGSRFGTRRPFLAVGALAGTAGMLVIAVAPSPAIMIVGWVVAQIGFASCPVALNALLAEQIPTRIRARVAAAFGMAQGIATFAGGFLIAALPPAPVWWFAVPSAIAVVFAVGLAVVLRDTVLPERRPIRWTAILSSYWVDPIRNRDFALGWLCRFFVTMAMVSVTLYLLFYLTDVLRIAADAAAVAVGTLLAVYFAASVVTTIVFGWLSDRSGRRKLIVCLSSVFTAIGLVCCVLSHDITSFGVGIALAGAGQGAYIAVDLALMTEILPAGLGAGEGLGVVALAYQLPQLVAPVAAAALLTIGGEGPNYQALFLAAAAAAVVGGLVVLPIRGVR